jgi:hypothetical protein
MGWMGFDSQEGQEIFLFSTASRPSLGPPSFLYKGYWELLPLGGGVQRLGYDADHSLPPSAKAKNGGAIHPLVQTAWSSVVLKHKDNFTFVFTIYQLVTHVSLNFTAMLFCHVSAANHRSLFEKRN